MNFPRLEPMCITPLTASSQVLCCAPDDLFRMNAFTCALPTQVSWTVNDHRYKDPHTWCEVQSSVGITSH